MKHWIMSWCQRGGGLLPPPAEENTSLKFPRVPAKMFDELLSWNGHHFLHGLRRCSQCSGRDKSVLKTGTDDLGPRRPRTRWPRPTFLRQNYWAGVTKGGRCHWAEVPKVGRDGHLKPENHNKIMALTYKFALMPLIWNAPKLITHESKIYHSI